MSDIKKESSATSEVLFLNVKGEPMRFFIRPGPTKVQLQPLIYKGGGILCRTQEPNAILLADPGDITAAVGSASHFYISTRYIHDCVVQNQQLDIEHYRYTTSHPIQTRAVSRKQRSAGRMGYSPEEDAAILNFVIKHQKQVKGNLVWQQMARQGVTGHSWQSMKDRFLKHLQHKLEQKSPENKKKVSPTKRSSSSPRKTAEKKAVVVLSSDSDATLISCEHDGGTTEQSDLQVSAEEISIPHDPASENKQTDEMRKETDGEESVPEKGQQHDGEKTEVSPKKVRMDTETPVMEKKTSAMDTLSGTNDHLSNPSKKPNSPKPSPPPRRKLGILEKAAREFEDSQLIDESQEDQSLSQSSPLNASDTDESQIRAARERAIREQKVNPEHTNDAEEPAPGSQNQSSSPGPDDDDPGPSNAALPIMSAAHMFIFQQESQEDLSQPSEEEQPSQSLLETKQHVVSLMEESKKDLVEVMKALLKASGDVRLALSYLLEGYDPEVHAPIWTRHDDKILLLDDSFACERLQEKYGAESVSRRAAFLKEGL